MSLQEVFSTFTSGTDSMMNTTSEDAGPNDSSARAGRRSSPPSDLSGLLVTLLSFSALQDWIKLIVLGGFFEACRRIAMSLYAQLVNAFFITVSFDEDDPSYDWMMIWLSKQTTWNKARQYQVSTKSFGLESMAVAVPGEDDEHGQGRKLAYLPSVSSSYSIWYKRRWITVNRQRLMGTSYSRSGETLVLSICTRSQDFLNELLLDAKREYSSVQEHNISIYISDKSNCWRLAATRPKRPLHSIVLEPGVKELLVSDARDFLDSKSWYIDRGIPFRRGYLLYGAPGSGKTSTIHSIAGELGLDVYIVSLSRAGLDDTSLNELVSDLPERCIALMEDIDAAFHHGVNREAPLRLNNLGDTDAVAPYDQSANRLSLSGLLNALDGVGAQEGRILYATTNKYLALDPALCRPGRMDIHVEFRLASKYQAYELFRRFYQPSSSTTDDAENDVAGEEEEEKDLGSIWEAPDSDVEDTEISSLLKSSSSPFSQGTSPITGCAHSKRPPRLSRRRMVTLATSFADAIPDREFSMASLQGYLMAYKTRPFHAIRDVQDWVKGEAEKQKSLSGKVAPPTPIISTNIPKEDRQCLAPLTPTSPIRRDQCLED